MGKTSTKRKMKPILPSLRQKKRYIAFEVISETPITDSRGVSDEIFRSQLYLFGQSGVSLSGTQVLSEAYNPTTQKGIIKVGNKYINKSIAALTLIQQIKNQKVIVRTLGVSGILKKIKNRHLAC